MKKLLSVIIACGAGGFFGTFIGLHFFHSLSILGCIVALASGCFMGYFLYDFEEVITGIKHSWKKMTVSKEYPAKTRLRFNEKRPLLLYYGYLSGIIKDTDSKLYFFLFNSLYPIIIMLMSSQFHFGVVWVIVPMAGVILTATLLASLMTSTRAAFGNKFTYRKSVEEIRTDITQVKAMVGITPNTPKMIQWLILNPLILPIASMITGVIWFVRLIARNWLVILTWCWKSIVWIFRTIIKGVWFIIKFTGYVIKYVHSDRRLLCLCDSALGTSMGLVWHSPFIGLTAGAVSGLISYQLISIKLLKLQLKH